MRTLAVRSPITEESLLSRSAMEAFSRMSWMGAELTRHSQSFIAISPAGVRDYDCNLVIQPLGDRDL